MPTTINGLPVGSAYIRGDEVTVSYLLNQPRILEQRIQEAANIDYWADRLLPNIGGAPAGMLGFEEWEPDFNWSSRRPEERGPDDEVPLTGASVGDLTMVEARPIGLGYAITDTMRDRNQTWVVRREERAFANTLADYFNQQAVNVVTAAIDDNSRYYAAPDWSAIVADGANPTQRGLWPHATITAIRAQQRKDRIPFTYDVMLAEPFDVQNLQTIYDTDDLSVIARRLGLTDVISDTTGRIDRGEPVLGASAGVGGTAWERPIRAETIDERRKTRTVVQVTPSVIYFVHNSYGLLKLRGVARAALEG